jgi:hypothetical protein
VVMGTMCEYVCQVMAHSVMLTVCPEYLREVVSPFDTSA